MSAEVVPHSNLQKPEARPGDVIKRESFSSSFDRFHLFRGIATSFSAVCDDPQWHKSIVAAESTLSGITNKEDKGKVAFIFLCTFADFAQRIKAGTISLTDNERTQLISELSLQFIWNPGAYLSLAPIGLSSFISASRGKLPGVTECLRSIANAVIAIEELIAHCKASRYIKGACTEAALGNQEFAKSFAVEFIAAIYSRNRVDQSESVADYCDFAKNFISHWPDRAPHALLVAVKIFKTFLPTQLSVQKFEALAEKINELFSRFIEKMPGYVESELLRKWTERDIDEFAEVLVGGNKPTDPQWHSALIELLLCSGIMSLEYRQSKEAKLLLGRIARKPGFDAQDKSFLLLLASIARNAKTSPPLQVFQLINERLEDSGKGSSSELLDSLNKLAEGFSR